MRIIANGSDVSPFVGVGFYGTKRVNNVNKYRAIWLPKVQFAEPNDGTPLREKTLSLELRSLKYYRG